MSTSRITPILTVSGPKHPDRDSVLLYPDPPFVDTITAQFAALAGEARSRAFVTLPRRPALKVAGIAEPFVLRRSKSRLTECSRR